MTRNYLSFWRRKKHRATHLSSAMCTVPDSNSRKPGLLSRHSCRVVQNQENFSSILPPYIFSLNLSAIQNSKEALHMPRRMYSINISFKNYPSFNTTFPSMLTPSWYKLYFDTGKWGKESWTREKVREATVHKAGSKLPIWLTYVSPFYKLWLTPAKSLYK
jgi:hypothetical protein